ncbi:MAG: caspase family protein, partial [Geminicoccaceae bacterium]
DGRLEDQYSLRRLVRLDQLIQDTGGARKLAVVIVDACRDDPLAGRQSATRSLAIPKGLAQPGYVPPRTLVAYATSPGMVAYDGSGRNSPYVSALLRHIKTPGVKVQDMFAAVTGDVARETKDAQRPGTYSSLDAEAVYLVPSAPAATGVELSELTHAEVQAIQLSLSWLGFWSGNADGVVSPTLLDAVHRWQGSQSAGVADTMTTAEIVALHRRAARSRPREPLPPIGNMNQLLRQVQQGDAEAQRLLGMVNDPAFEAGPWPKDRQSAREWYKSAATEGDAEAAARLGLMLASPSGSAADQPEARQWLGKAAQSGQTEAALRLAELLLDEGESSPARAQAIELLKTAAASPATEGFANALLRDLGYQVVVSSNP